MGLNHCVDINALNTSIANYKYLAWFVNNQHLFGPHPSSYMSYPTVLNITVQASRVENRPIPIEEVPFDATLRQSLISPDYAQATRGTIVGLGAAISIQDTQGRAYTSSSYVTLNWWIRDGWSSNLEDFYITDDLPSNCHAMLHRMPENGTPKNRALPLFNSTQTTEQKKRAEERRILEDKNHSATRQAENQKMEDKTTKLTSSSTKQPSKHARPSNT